MIYIRPTRVAVLLLMVIAFANAVPATNDDGKSHAANGDEVGIPVGANELIHATVPFDTDGSEGVREAIKKLKSVPARHPFIRADLKKTSNRQICPPQSPWLCGQICCPFNQCCARECCVAPFNQRCNFYGFCLSSLGYSLCRTSSGRYFTGILCAGSRICCPATMRCCISGLCCF